MANTHKRSDSVHLRRLKSIASIFSAPDNIPTTPTSTNTGGSYGKKIDLDQVTLESERLQKHFSQVPQHSTVEDDNQNWWGDVFSSDQDDYTYRSRVQSRESLAEIANKLPELLVALIERFMEKNDSEKPLEMPQNMNKELLWGKVERRLPLGRVFHVFKRKN